MSDWKLTEEQWVFMRTHESKIEQAFATDNMDYLREFAASDGFKNLFGEMTFDEAYDRYTSEEQ